MPLLDLASVTRSLQKLLQENINYSFFDGAETVSVTAEAPDKVGSVMNKISMFMYHIGEEAHYKNLVGPGTGSRNIARTPMSLCLYYIMTPHHESPTPENDPLTQQSLMGYALKTLHDYPLVDDDTVIDGVTILQGDMIDNHNPMQIILRPVTPEDSISFWGAEDSQTTRLSAYYEVRVILLEPDEPATVAAPVLSLGTYLYQLGTPHLERSRSELPFTLPSSAGSSDQLVEVTPGRASADTGEDPPHNRVSLVGQNLAGGQSRQVWLRSPALTDAVGGPLPVDLSIANNSDWGLSVSDGELILDLDDTLYYLDSDDVEQDVPILPGIYTAFLRVTVSERLVGGTLVPITNDSNEVAFVVIPRIDSDSKDAMANKIDLTIVATFELDLAGLELQVYVDGTAYTKKTGTTAAGQYEVIDSTTLRFHALFDVDTDGEHPTRLLVNGAESAPYWIETTAP